MPSHERRKQYKVGQKFTYYGSKHQGESTIEDIYVTRNEAKQIVRIEYRSSHMFLGQKVYTMHNAVAIAKSLYYAAEKNLKKS